MADAQPTLDQAIFAQTQVVLAANGLPNATPAQVDAFLRSNAAAAAQITGGVTSVFLAQTQGLALDVTQQQVCGAVACPADCAPHREAAWSAISRVTGMRVTGTVGLQWRADDEHEPYLRYAAATSPAAGIASAT